MQREWQIDRYRPIGVHILSPDGRLLASSKAPSTTADLLSFLNNALNQFGNVSPRNIRPTSVLPDEGIGLRADGSIRLSITVRTLAGGRPTGKGPIRDNLLLSAADLRALLPPQGSQKFTVAEATARKFALLISDGPDPVYAIRPQDVTSAQIQAMVIKSGSEGGEVRFKGAVAGARIAASKEYPEGQTTLEGYLNLDTHGRPIRLGMIGSGQFRMPWQREYHDIGALAEWRIGK